MLKIALSASGLATLQGEGSQSDAVVLMLISTSSKLLELCLVAIKHIRITTIIVAISVPN